MAQTKGITSTGQAEAVKFAKKKMSLETTLLLMTLPFVIFILIFSYLPLLGWVMAFVDYSPGVSVFNSDFVGFKFFKEIFTYTSEFPQVMVNTFAMSFLGILASPLPAILAILITEIKFPRFKRFLQTATSLPNFMSWIIVYSIGLAFFSVDDGLFNQLLLKLHLIKDPTNVLANSDIVWYVQTLFGIWKTIGWSAIIYIGAIAGIEQELYEAARVDGATRLKQIWHITVPGIMPTFAVLMFLSIGYILSGTSFEQIFVFHNGIVHDKIQTLDYYTYVMGIKNLNFSLSTAIGIFKTVVSLVLLFISAVAFKKITGRSIV